MTLYSNLSCLHFPTITNSIPWPKGQCQTCFITKRLIISSFIPLNYPKLRTMFILETNLYLHIICFFLNYTNFIGDNHRNKLKRRRSKLNIAPSMTYIVAIKLRYYKITITLINKYLISKNNIINIISYYYSFINYI